MVNMLRSTVMPSVDSAMVSESPCSAVIPGTKEGDVDKQEEGAEERVSCWRICELSSVRRARMAVVPLLVITACLTEGGDRESRCWGQVSPLLKGWKERIPANNAS